MSRIRQARELREEGFTLIELLIVIVVLGILAGIVVFGVGTFRSDSQAAACNADMKTVSVASDAWNAKFGSYPADVATLVTAKYLKTAPNAAQDGDPILIDSGNGTVTPGVGHVVGCTAFPAP